MEEEKYFEDKNKTIIFHINTINIKLISLN